MKLKEKIKNFWERFKEERIKFYVGVYIASMVFAWVGYFIRFIPLMGAILPTILIPLILFGVYYIRKLDNRTIYKIVWIVCGGIFIGAPIWAISYYILIGAPWAPLNETHDILKDSISILIMVPIFGVAAYLMYRLGKRRDFRPFA